MPPVSTVGRAVGRLEERVVGDLARPCRSTIVDERLVRRPRAEAGEAVPVEVRSVVLLERGAVVVPHRALDVRVGVDRDAVLGQLRELLRRSTELRLPWWPYRRCVPPSDSIAGRNAAQFGSAMPP